MEDEQTKLVRALERIAFAERQRGHATWFHASNEFQAPMEVAYTMEWAQTINERHGCNIRNVRNNPEIYPDCIANIGPEGAKRTATIGIEVTELVDRDAIAAHQEFRKLAEEGLLQGLSETDLRALLQRGTPKWPAEKFKACLEARMIDKDRRTRVSSLEKQILLVLTAEPFLEEHILARYCGEIMFPRPRNFDSVYLMSDYVPDDGGNGYYPVFELSLDQIE